MFFEFLKEHNIPVTTAARILFAHYIETDKDEKNFIQRIQKLASGEYKQTTPEEERAFQRFIHVETNKHEYGQVIDTLQRQGFSNTRTEIYKKLYNSGQSSRRQVMRVSNQLKPIESLFI